MTWKIAVLGGSSPFTVSLIDALREQAADLPRFTLALHGRDEANLAAVAGYTAHCLRDIADPPVSSTDMAAVVGGADVVIHQIRYGGLALRGEGEALCERFGVAADETLGPAALATALAIRQQVGAVTDVLARHCPDAWVLNLTNPLSCVTAWMHERLDHVVGICELPLYTLHQAAAALAVPVGAIDFGYTGLNHRGFFYRLRMDGTDLLARLGTMGGDVSIGGIDGTTVAELGALPLKYFTLRHAIWAPRQRRAEALQGLSAQIFAELHASPSTSPSSLAQRYLAWYPMSVVPMLAALGSSRPSLQLCNIPRSDGLVVERFAAVSSAGIAAVEDAAPDIPPAVAEWIDRFERHERALLAAVERPSIVTIAEALMEDPSVPSARVEEIAEAMAAGYRSSPAAPRVLS